MPCGKIQIQKNVDGIEFNDNFLNIKPEISLFKTVHRHYVNFSSDTIPVYFNQENLIDFDNSSTFTCKIDNIGHLLNDIYLVLNIPTLNSGITAIPDLGIHMIELVTFTIGGYTIHEYDNDWINIYYKRQLSFEKYQSISSTINPTPSPNPLFSYNSQNIYVWLPFNFSRNVSLGIPLLNCLYDDIRITIRIRPLKYMFTINKQPIQDIRQYIYGGNTFSLFMHMHVYFFEKDVLKKLEAISREYFIEQTYIINYTGVASKTINIPILTKQIIKEFYIIAQRSDNTARNVFGNYTNYENHITLSGNYNENYPYIFSDYYNDSYKYDLYEQYSNQYNPEIIENIQLYLNGQPRFATLNSRFLRLVHTYSNGLNYNKSDYIYYYTFSNNSNEYNPNGALTLDRINDSNLVVYLYNTPPVKRQSFRTMINTVQNTLKGRSIQTITMDNSGETLFTYNIKIYITNYNIIKFKGGMAKLVWV